MEEGSPQVSEVAGTACGQVKTGIVCVASVYVCICVHVACVRVASVCVCVCVCTWEHAHSPLCVCLHVSVCRLLVHESSTLSIESTADSSFPSA